jgi:hypothetical protein
MKKVAGLLKRRFEDIITCLTHPITNATSESINAKIQWVKIESADNIDDLCQTLGLKSPCEN